MKTFFIFITIAVLISACTTSEDNKGSGNVKSDYADYFYPTDSIIPFIYVYQDQNNPLNEKIHRIYRLENQKDTTLTVEYFNADFRITEGFSFDIHSFLVKDHMVVSGDGLKVKTKLTSTSFFPLSKDDQTLFVSDFPSHLDSISMVNVSKTVISNADYQIEVLGEMVPALLVTDSTTWTMVNVYTQQGSSKKAVINRVYAKGYGLVQWSSSDGSIVYNLKKIHSNKWWEEVAQSPEARW